MHGTANHTLDLVDPATGVTTNRVEGMCQWAQAKFKGNYGLANQQIVPDYLAEFMWMQRYLGHTFYHFWHQTVINLYVV